ncbi:hypothetical protein LEN26_005679 [Aphanomyces euteiches]|nr:hypothetical protein AeMF1_000276 [Aphanomyces euteiches]KAH9137534.1 hypothetical protein LEN26_005679 [Aphanomyces euteiches]KAH9196846.1 hypothetical protein AeNC1_001160 [Aphanomyces euteiches]
MDREEQELLQLSMQEGLGHADESHELNMRPKTMFDVKGRARPSDNASESYLPQWSKDGEGFKKQANVLNEDRDRRKNKAIYRYTREELLKLHVVSSAPPECPDGTPVISQDSLPPVANLPFDYEEIYKQWASNKDRSRQPGRGRGQPRNDNNSSAPSTNNRASGNNSNGGRVGGGRSHTNDTSNDNNLWEKGRRGSDELNESSSRKWGDKRDDNWERGAKIESTSKDDLQEDLWDDVGGDSSDMGLSNFAEAAEMFRREMDQMHRAGGSEFRQQNSLDKEDQFADSVEEEEEAPMWDMPSTTTAEKSSEAEISAPVSLDLSSWSSFEQPAAPLRVAPPVDAWFYLDPQGLQQGPFKSAEMREWFEAGYFKPHLPIRFGHEGEFASLANHFRHGQIPFSTIPSPTPQQSLLEQQKAAAHQQQLLLQKQQLEQQQFLATQLQQQRLLEQRRLQEERMRIEMQRLELNHAAHQQEQARLGMLQQQFHYGQNTLGVVGSGWPRQTLPRDNIIAGPRDSMMGGLGMYGAPQPHVVESGPTEFPAPSWNTKEEPSGQSLWNASAKNDPELGSWGKTAEVEQQPAWAKPDNSWNKEVTPQAPVPSWGKQESAQPSTPNVLSGWNKPEAPQSSPTSWTKTPEPPAPAPSSWGKADTSQPLNGSWGKQPSLEAISRPEETPLHETREEKTIKEETASGWEVPAPETPSLKQIQQEEQEEMRRRLKPIQAKVQAQPKPQPAQQAVQPAKQPQQEPPAQQPHLADMGQQLKRMLGVSNPSPPKSWNAAPSPVPVTRSLSLRDIQAEEERLAQLKRQDRPAPVSRWSSVVTGTTPTPTVVPPAPRPAPVEVTTTPPKDRDANFWNFDSASSSASQQAVSRSTTPSVSAQNSSDDLISWSAKQVKKLGGPDDLTLIQLCATLEDPSEIREYLSANLGSTPKVSAFATEFIQRKKQLAGKKQSSNESFQKKKKGQKVDPSLLSYSVGGSRQNEYES